MSKLYGNELAKIYDKIYQGFIDYNEEFKFYAGICNEFKARRILEIACGSGNLAKPFIKLFEAYLGLDFSNHMLNLAREKLPEGNFLQGDMRNFVLAKKYGAALITGRSTSYLLSDLDLNQTFSSVYKVLEEPALFVFDCIDAEKFIPYIKENPEVTHTSKVDGILYSRDTKWFPKDGQIGNLVNWESIYLREHKGKKQELGRDNTLFRVFTRKEIQEFLKKNSFNIIHITDRKTYAFDTFVVVARKKN